MSFSSNSEYENLWKKIKFGRTLEKVCSSNDEKKQMISVFVDDTVENLFDNKFFEYKFDESDNGEEETVKKNKEKNLDVKQNDRIIRKFGKLILLNESKEFLEKNPELLCNESVHYLKNWSIELELNENFIGSERISYQTMIISTVLRLCDHSNGNSNELIRQFFDKITNADGLPTNEFLEEVRSYHDEIRDFAEKKNEEKDFNEGDVSLTEVIQSLPKDVLECIKSRNMQRLLDVLSHMPHDEAAQHVDRCLKSGILVRTTQDGDGE